MIRRYYILPLLAVLFATACNTGYEDTISEPQLELVIDIPQEQSTRTGDELNESKISTLDVFIYGEGENACTHYQRISPKEGMQRYGISKPKSNFAKNTLYVTYVVANGGDATNASKTLSELKETVTAVALDPDVKQAALLMDGRSQPTVLYDGSLNNDYIYISLKRAVAKIKVNLTYGLEYQPAGAVTKKLVNYASNSPVLEDGDTISPALASTGYTAPGTVSDSGEQIILYSYANDWNSASMDETFIYLNVPLDNEGTVENNYYKIPVNYRRSAMGTNETNLYKIRRNYIYDITVHINCKGSSTAPEAVVLESVDYEVINWTTNTVEAWLKDVEYLYVKDTEIEMMNVNAAQTTFQSSTSNVTITNLKIHVEGVQVANSDVHILVQPGTQGNIDIISPIPGNFVPRIIEFDVENGTSIKRHVRVSQYPPLWIGSITSAASSSNNNMYTINVKLADLTNIPPPNVGTYGYWASGRIEGCYFDLTGKRYTGPRPYDDIETRPAQENSNFRIGYPLLDINGYTKQTHENAYMLSPNYMFASKASNTGLCSKWVAVSRCSNYSETGADGTVYTGWRTPTYAELTLIDMLQNIDDCAIQTILTGHRYWCIDPGNSYAYRILNPRDGKRSGEDEYTAEVRCVRDIGRPLK